MHSAACQWLHAVSSCCARRYTIVFSYGEALENKYCSIAVCASPTSVRRLICTSLTRHACTPLFSQRPTSLPAAAKTSGVLAPSSVPVSKSTRLVTIVPTSSFSSASASTGTYTGSIDASSAPMPSPSPSIAVSSPSSLPTTPSKCDCAMTPYGRIRVCTHACKQAVSDSDLLLFYTAASSTPNESTADKCNSSYYLTDERQKYVSPDDGNTYDCALTELLTQISCEPSCESNDGKTLCCDYGRSTNVTKDFQCIDTRSFAKITVQLPVTRYVRCVCSVAPSGGSCSRKEVS